MMMSAMKEPYILAPLVSLIHKLWVLECSLCLLIYS